MAWLLAKLSSQGRRVYHILLAMAERGYSGRRALEELRRLGLGYRMTEFYRDWAAITGHAQRADRVKHVPKNKRISLDLHTPSTWLRPGEYAYTVKVDVVCRPKPFSTKPCAIGLKPYITVISNYRMTPDEIAEAAERMISAYNPDPDYCDCRVLNAFPVSAYRGVEPWEAS